MTTRETVVVAGHAYVVMRDELTALLWLEGETLPDGPLRTPFKDLAHLNAWLDRFSSVEQFELAATNSDFAITSAVLPDSVAVQDDIVSKIADRFVEVHRQGYAACLSDMGLAVDNGLLSRSTNRDKYWNQAVEILNVIGWGKTNEYED